MACQGPPLHDKGPEGANPRLDAVLGIHHKRWPQTAAAGIPPAAQALSVVRQELLRPHPISHLHAPRDASLPSLLDFLFYPHHRRALTSSFFSLLSSPGRFFPTSQKLLGTSSLLKKFDTIGILFSFFRSLYLPFLRHDRHSTFSRDSYSPHSFSWCSGITVCNYSQQHVLATFYF